MKNKVIVWGILCLLNNPLLYGKWKIGTITNQTTDLVLESAGYGKAVYTPVTYLTEKLTAATTAKQPITLNSLVSQRSHGCCMIKAKKGSQQYQISFDGYASLAIKQGRKKTQVKTNKQCVGTNACDPSKYDYCARAFVEILSTDNQWTSVYCDAQGYNVPAGQTYATFDIIISELNGVYKIQLQPAKTQ